MMKGLIRQFAIFFSVFLMLLAVFFWHYLDVLDAVLESGDTELYTMYMTIGISTILVGCISLLLIRHYHPEAMEQTKSVLGRIRSAFRLTIGKAYFVSIFFFGMLYMAVLPPLSAPDEISHYITAYKLSSTLLLERATAEDGHVYIRKIDLILEDMRGEYILSNAQGTYEDPVVKVNRGTASNVLSQTLEEEDYDLILKKGAIGQENDGSVALSEFPPVFTAPFAYMPQAIGIALARALNLNSFALVFLGRFFNLLFFCILTTFALKMLPFGKEIYFGIHLLPMTLHLAASFSYDAFILGIFGLYTAYCLHLAFKAEKVKNKDIAVLAALLLLVGACKMVYIPLALLGLLIPTDKFGTRMRKFLSALIVIAALGIGFLFVDRGIYRNYQQITGGYVSWAQEAGYILPDLWHNPIRVLRLLYNTMIYQTGFYHRTMLGGYLGNLDPILDISYPVLAVLTFCLVGLGLAKKEEEPYFSVGQRIGIGIIFLLCAGLIMLSMLIGWTPISSMTVQGVQGRYFLPMLALGLMLIKNKILVFQTEKDRFFLGMICLCNAYVLMRICSLICLRIG